MIATQGKPVTLSPTAQSRLAAMGITQSYLLGTRDGRSYYRFEKQDGTLCYGVSAVTNPDPPGMVICLNSDTVPPVLDFSVYQRQTGDTSLSVWRLEGLVNSPGIARVDVLGSDGQVTASAPVVNGAYYVQPPSAVPASAIQTVDAHGNVVHKAALGQAPSNLPN